MTDLSMFDEAVFDRMQAYLSAAEGSPTRALRLAVYHELQAIEGDPSDEEILAALNATVKPADAAPDLIFWGEETVAQMRASLRAVRQLHIERKANA